MQKLFIYEKPGQNGLSIHTFTIYTADYWINSLPVLIPPLESIEITSNKKKQSAEEPEQQLIERPLTTLTYQSFDSNLSSILLLSKYYEN